MPGKITIIHGADKGKSIVLFPKTVFGRKEPCHMVLKDGTVSSKHCEINFEQDHFVIQDLQSTHGTFVNRIRISRPQVLKDKDVIRIGKTEFCFEEMPIIKTPEKSIPDANPYITEILFDEEKNILASAQDLKKQEKIAEHYRMLEKIWGDQYVTFYKAEHINLHNIVILKVFHSHPNLTPTQSGDLQRILDRLKKLKNPNIAQLYVALWRDNELILVADYIQGKNLLSHVTTSQTHSQITHSQIQSSPKLAWRKIIKIVYYVATALDYIHNQGIYHKGLNLSNIILEEGTGIVKLDNVALLSILQQYQLTNPEWITENSFFQPHPSVIQQFSSVACDLYSLGCIFLFLFWGKCPERLFNAEEWLNLIQLLDLPSTIINILKKLLVEHSIGSAKELSLQLAQIDKSIHI